MKIKDCIIGTHVYYDKADPRLADISGIIHGEPIASGEGMTIQYYIPVKLDDGRIRNFNSKRLAISNAKS